MNDFFHRYALRISKPTERGCREWKGARCGESGYGHGTRDKVHFYAHRAAYECVHGTGSADGLIVRHRCDNPPCCEPTHLIGGTQVDNMADAAERSRIDHARGERHGRAVLTSKDAVAIRAALARGVSGTDLAAQYGVHHNTIYAIKNGETWR